MARIAIGRSDSMTANGRGLALMPVIAWIALHFCTAGTAGTDGTDGSDGTDSQLDCIRVRSVKPNLCSDKHTVV